MAKVEVLLKEENKVPCEAKLVKGTLFSSARVDEMKLEEKTLDYSQDLNYF